MSTYRGESDTVDNGESLASATDIANAVEWAQEWAVKAEDTLISGSAGGDGSTDYSSLHWAAKSAASASAASASETAAAASEVATAADAVSTAADAASTAADAISTAADAVSTDADATAAAASAAAASVSETNAAASAAAAAASEAAAKGIDVTEIGNIMNPLLHMPLNNSLGIPIGTGVATFSRTTIATYVDRYGVVQSAAINEPRFEKEGLLIEGASTNLFTYSEDLSHASWSVQGGITITANNTTAPDGTTTADKVDFGHTGSPDAILKSAVAPAGTHTVSLWVKAVSSDTTIQIAHYNATDGYNSSGDIVVASAGWTRISWTFTNTVTSTVYPITDNSTQTSLSIWGWGMQLETLSLASSYIPTTTAAVARTADVLTLTSMDNYPGNTEYQTYLADVDILGAAGAAINQYAFAVAGVTDVNLLPVLGSTGKPHSNLGTVLNSTTALTVNQVYRLAARRSSSGVSMWRDGILDLSDASPAAITGTHTAILIGTDLYGHISNFRIYNGALNDNEMRVA